MHKLSSPCEGPYVVKEVTQPGSYRLCDLDGLDVPNSWHIEHLIRFYLETLQICILHYIMNEVLVAIIYLHYFSITV